MVFLIKVYVKLLLVDFLFVFDVLGVVDYIDKNDMFSLVVNYWGVLYFEEVFFVEDEVYIVG